MWDWLTGRSKVARLYGPEEWPGQFEQDFETLSMWERSGIFPRIYGGGAGPDWYMAEKQRRGLVITPVRIVTPDEFARGGP